MKKSDERLLTLRFQGQILIVGSGSMGSKHFKLADEIFPSARVELVSRHELRLMSNENFSENPLILVIATGASQHANLVKEFAIKGIHFLIEKPLSTSVSGIKELIRICEQNNQKFLVGYNLRFLPSLNYFKSLYEQGVAGNVLSVRCEVGQYLPDWRSGKDYRESVSAKSELGGGVLLELSHEIDYLRWIFGEIEWVMASATRQSKLEIDVEDQTLIILGFKSSMNSSQLIGSLGMDFIRHDKTRTCTVIGEETSIRWDGVKGTVEVFDRVNQIWQVVFEQSGEIEESYKAEWLELINSIEENRDPCVTGWDGLIVLEIIEAIRASASSKQQMIVNYEESNSRNR
jgi:predicted dehydrogenase